jgi:hypothetical protein
MSKKNPGSIPGFFLGKSFGKTYVCASYTQLSNRELM